MGRRDEAIALGETLWQSWPGAAAEDGYAQVIGSNLAQAYARAGRLDDAERLHREILAVRERTLGPRDERTLSTYNNLGMTLMKRDRLDEAQSFLGRAASLRREVLGPDHPKTLGARGNCAVLAFKLGRFAEAA